MVSDALKKEYIDFLTSRGGKPVIHPTDDELRKFLREEFEQFKAYAIAGGSELNRMIYLQMSEDEINMIIEAKLLEPRDIVQASLDKHVENLNAILLSHKQLAFDTSKYYVTTYPTNSINASIVPRENGYFILLDEGLRRFILKYTQIYFSMFNVPSLEAFDKAAQMIAELVLCYLTNTDVTTISSRLPKTMGLTVMMQQDYLDFCEKFVIAHEFGHSINGHFENDNRANIQAPDGVIEIVNRNWLQEYEADLTGLNIIILDSINAEKKDPHRRRGNVSMAIAGCILFFVIDNTITEIYKLVKGINNKALLSVTHPPSDLRIENIKKFIEEAGLSNQFKLAEGLLNFNDKLLRNVLEKIRNDSHKFSFNI